MLMQRICIVPLIASLVLTAAVGPGAATNLPTYPKDILGAWTPDGTPCGEPINYDSETLLLIEEKIMGQYENTNGPLEVSRLSSVPRVWKIVSEASPGTGEYSGRHTEILVLTGIKLTIASDRESRIFIRCK